MIQFCWNEKIRNANFAWILILTGSSLTLLEMGKQTMLFWWYSKSAMAKIQEYVKKGCTFKAIKPGLCYLSSQLDSIREGLYLTCYFILSIWYSVQLIASAKIILKKMNEWVKEWVSLILLQSGLLAD